MAEHNETGKKGEDIAAKYLLENNYKILERNWRAGHLEIDIIAKIKDIIVIVEVKTRTSTSMYDPAMAVNRIKQKQLIRAANKYILSSNLSNEVRFDIISVFILGSQHKLEHLTDAFYPTL